MHFIDFKAILSITNKALRMPQLSSCYSLHLKFENMQQCSLFVPCERSVLHEGFAGKTSVLRRAAPKPIGALPLARHSPPRNTYNYIYNAHAEIIYISAEFATIGGN